MKCRILLLTALLALAPAVFAEAYKCRLPDGRIEFSDSGCPNSTTLTIRRDETVSPERRAQAEREAERMRDYVEQREAASRAGEPARPPATAANSAAPAQVTIDECLRELERQALSPGQRAEMETACRTSGKAQPVADGIPVYPVSSGVGQCLRNVERQHLPAAERARRINQCQGIYPPPPPPPRPAPLPARPPETSRPADCPGGRKPCYR